MEIRFNANVKVERENPDKEYWDYISSYGSDEERAEAAEYFDVSPDAFDEDYDSVKGD